MKKLILLFLVLLNFYNNAQTSCENALPFCAGGVSGITFPATTTVTAAQPGPNYGCLNSTPNPAWYYLQINTSGNLDILIQGQLNNPPPPGQDVDFICWGPFSSLAGICNSLTAGNTIDCSYSPSFTETLNIPNGVSGEYYMVLITNFSGAQQDIVFTQFGGTGSTNCALVTNNSKICAGTSATIVANNSGSLTSTVYSLSPGNITNTTGTFIVTPTITTNYTIYVTGNNSSNVAITQTAVSSVSVDPQPLVTPTVINTSCTTNTNSFNLNLSFFPANPPPSYTVNWSPIPGGVNDPTLTALSGTISPGTYNATITAAGGCKVETSFTLNPIPAPAIITLNPINLTHYITCYQPTVSIMSMDASSNYTWTNQSIAPITGTLAEFTSTATGNWTIYAVNPVSGCEAQKTFTVILNTTPPTSSVAPTFQNITCNLTSITTVSATGNPSVNVTHQVYAPQGGTFSAQSHTMIYVPGGVGTFTHCLVNDANGCSSCNTFTVFSNQGFPTYTVSSPQNFTLGCNSKSVAIINIVTANTTPPGGAVSYSIIGPPTSTATPSGSLSTISTYTVNTPGTWTVITKDNISFCETRTPISVLSNTFAPNLNVVVPQTVLDCYVPKVTLRGESLTQNVGYTWSFQATPGNLQSDTITVKANTSAPNNSLVGNYTLTITDNNSTCTNFSVVPILQNIFPPNALISGGSKFVTCTTNTFVLTNQSSTGIPPGLGFSYQLPVLAYLWEGPTPQVPAQFVSSYVAGMVGNYTLTVRDSNNGCLAVATASIGDNRIFPILSKAIGTENYTLDCGSLTRTITASLANQEPSFTYTWIAAPTASVSGEHTSVLTVNQSGQYKVLITNGSNGCSSSAVVSVKDGSLTAGFEAQPQKGFAPLKVTLFNNSKSSDTILSKASLNITANWSFGNGKSARTTTDLSTATTYSLPGRYKVMLFATKGNCLDTISKYIDVEIPSELEIPNVFTPNGDGVNDLFFVKATNLENISVLIYDRWGHSIYELNTKVGNISWDGKNQAGNEMADGTYFYIIKAQGSDGQSYNKKGTISLYR